MRVHQFRAAITARKNRMSEAQAAHILGRRKAKNRMNRLAALRREALAQALGGCCVQCGEMGRLEFDHAPEPPRGLSYLAGQAVRFRLTAIVEGKLIHEVNPPNLLRTNK